MRVSLCSRARQAAVQARGLKVCANLVGAIVVCLFRKNGIPEVPMTARRNTSSQRLSMLSAKLWLLLAALEVARAPFEHAPLDGIVKHPDVKIGKGHGKGHGKKQKLEGPGSDEDAAVESPSAIFHKRKVALVTGITGQDGSYLAELLLAKGCACFALHSSLRMRFIFLFSRSRIYSQTRCTASSVARARSTRSASPASTRRTSTSTMATSPTRRRAFRL